MSVTLNLNPGRLFFTLVAVGIAIACAVLLLRPTTNAAPEFLNYQGTLMDSAGQPLANGAHQLVFNIYDTAQPGGAEQLVWGPFTAEAEIVQGRFNVVLGPADTALVPRSLREAFQGDGDRFIEIKVDGGAAILPRQQFLSVPYAVQASNGVPVGGILPWWGNASDVPDGFELCDGREITMPGAILTGNTPNLRGRFLRGAEDLDEIPAGLSSGGVDSVDLQHDHTMTHTHSSGSLLARVSMGGDGGNRNVAMDEKNTSWPIDRSISGIAGSGTVNGGTGTKGAVVQGATGGSSRSRTALALSQMVDNRPAYREVFYLIRVK